MHPLQPDLTTLTDNEIDEKIKELTKKYFMAMSLSPSAAQQIVLLLDDYKFEYQLRLEKKKNEMQKNLGSDLDDLINIG
jgi:hypothetical protein